MTSKLYYGDRVENGLIEDRMKSAVDITINVIMNTLSNRFSSFLLLLVFVIAHQHTAADARY